MNSRNPFRPCHPFGTPQHPIAALLALLAALNPAFATINLVPNPTFQGSGGSIVGAVTGTVPDQWRGFAVGGGAADISIIPLAANELYWGSPPTNAVKLKVTAFGADQGFDNWNVPFKMYPNGNYHLEVYVKSGDPNGTYENFTWGFPLFDANGNCLGREPGACPGSTWEDSVWYRFVGPTFSDPQAAYGAISFRVLDNTYYPGERSIIIAMPDVEGPLDSFPLPTAADLAQRTTWSSNDKLVGTTYFYWYRWPDRHFFNQPGNLDALTEHFPSPQTVSTDSKDWHKQQLTDMMAAQIDMLWPVYWGAPGNFDNPDWSFFWQALAPLQTAIDEVKSEGKTPPKIGMFYDTSTLGTQDLTTQAGQDFFYKTIQSFFCNVQPKNWACIDDHPLVVLYGTGAVSAYNQAAFDYVKSQFAADFGGLTPYIIREQSWNVSTDSVYRWGAALRGPYLDGIAAIGPGYNDSACPGRSTPIRLRENGGFYRWSWLQVLRSPARIVHLETWSEMHEGTEICESAEWGRQYIDLTATYAGYFKAGIVPNETVTLLYPDPVPRPPNMQDGAEYADARSVEISTSTGPGGQKINAGIDDRSNADGSLTLTDHAGDTWLQTDSGSLKYAYFGLKDPFYFDQHRRAQVTLWYLDEGMATVQLNYDSYDRTAAMEGAYTNAPAFNLTNTGTLKSWTTVLENPRFANRENGFSDFRFAVTNGPLYIKRVHVDVLDLPQPVLKVSSLSPSPGAAVGARTAIVANLAAAPLASTVNAANVLLVRSGGDGAFGNGNDVAVAPAGFTVNSSQVIISLAGMPLPNDTYQLTLVGRGPYPITDASGRPLDGKFAGTLPSGDGTGGGNFVATFTFTQRGDFDGDSDVDQDDFGRLQACFSGSNPVPAGCDAADFDSNGHVDGADLLIFRNCMAGPNATPACR